MQKSKQPNIAHEILGFFTTAILLTVLVYCTLFVGQFDTQHATCNDYQNCNTPN